jgi:hypothetical protein
MRYGHFEHFVYTPSRKRACTGTSLRARRPARHAQCGAPPVVPRDPRPTPRALECPRRRRLAGLHGAADCPSGASSVPGFASMPELAAGVPARSRHCGHICDLKNPLDGRIASRWSPDMRPASCPARRTRRDGTILETERESGDDASGLSRLFGIGWAPVTRSTNTWSKSR